MTRGGRRRGSRALTRQAAPLILASRPTCKLNEGRSRNLERIAAPMRHLLVPLLCCPLVIPSAKAEIYRYVDDNGMTVYSQSPPPDGEVKVIKPEPGPSETTSDETKESLESWLEAEQKRRQDEKAAAKERENAAAEAAERRAGCEAARRSLQALQRVGQPLVRDEDGRIRYITVDERERRLKAAREQIDELCDGAGRDGKSKATHDEPES